MAASTVATGHSGGCEPRLSNGVITGLMVGGYGKAMESRTVQF